MARLISKRKRRTSGIKLPPPFIFLFLFLAGYYLDRIIPFLNPRWHKEIQLGKLSILGALALLGWCWFLFFLSDTSPIPTRPTRALVTRGPYRFTRNPMYIGLAMLYAGTATLVHTFWPLALLPVAFLIIHFRVVKKEEIYLQSRFGLQYNEYRRRVRRWI